MFARRYYLSNSANIRGCRCVTFAAFFISFFRIFSMAFPPLIIPIFGYFLQNLSKFIAGFRRVMPALFHCCQVTEHSECD